MEIKNMFINIFAKLDKVQIILLAIAALMVLALIVIFIIALVSKGKKQAVNIEKSEVIEENNEKTNESQNDELTQQKDNELKDEPKEKTTKTTIKKSETSASKSKTTRKKEQTIKEKKEEKNEVKAEEAPIDEEKPTRAQKYMVTYDKEKKDWVIKKTGSTRASKRCKTKKEALEIAEHLAASQDMNLSIKKKDGKFQKASNAKK